MGCILTTDQLGGPLPALKAPMRMALFGIVRHVLYPSRLCRAQTLNTSAIANTSLDPPSWVASPSE